VRAYVASVLVTLLFGLLQAALGRIPGGEPVVVMLVIPVILSAYVGGLGPGLVSTAIACLVSACDLRLVDPAPGLVVLTLTRLSALLVSGVLISALLEALRRSRAYAMARKREGEQARRDTEVRLATVVNSAEDGILTVDDNQRITFFNPAAEEIFGHPAATILGQPLSRLIPARFHSIHAETASSFVDHGTTKRRKGGMAVVGLRADGTEFPAEVSIARGEVGGRPMVTAIVRDITERHQAEVALRESEARFRELAAAVREVFIIFEASSGRIVYVSPPYQALTGHPPEAVSDSIHAWLDRLPPDKRPGAEATLQSLLAGSDATFDYTFVRADGATRELQATAYPVRDADGKVVRVAAILEDVTERRALEAQLRQAQKMESVGLLAGGIAHDFNNLLSVILAGSQMLLRDISATERTTLVGEVLAAGERAAGLTRQLLAFSRRAVFQPQLIDLNTVIADSEKMLGRLLGEDVEVQTALADDLGEVNIDPGLWVQVLMNLAVNARDAMPRGGQLRIETREVELGEDHAATRPGVKPGRYVVVSVTDTGTGMTEAVRARVFEPFFTTKPMGRGTGLGLSVVDGIIAQSGGHIQLQTELGKGTTFQIHLPVAHAPEVAQGVTNGRSALSGKETVLLVEDDATVRSVTRRSLDIHGYSVLEARGGEEALAVLGARKGRVDLLVTDVVMPKMGGRELVDAVHGMYPEVRVLFTSGFADDTITRHGVTTAEVAFLQKPYTVESLLGKVREALRRAD
jgi:PAS domain S-box-containing protein